ncbi:MAG: thioredoxin family protein [Gammaproteobacteria bacterium]|nr:thioredoxin family protein [Gammaproteobacteria bacterium]
MIAGEIKKIGVLLLIVLVLFVSPVTNALASSEPVWYEKDINEQPIIHLYFFWSEKCPHCLQAQPDIIEMDKEYPWLKLHSLELVHHQENVKTFVDMAARLGGEANTVPAFMFCGNSITGYDSQKTTGQLLRAHLQACYQFAKEYEPDNGILFTFDQNELTSVDIPVLGNISSDNYSLPVLTVLIAGMDAFNPCAFFVLLFLLSMMVHARSRSRMALIGGVFVFFSGAIYFLFMAAWLNLFIYLGELRLITLIAGSIAILIALVNIKDFFWFKKGFSLSISDDAKPKLFDRMRNLLRLDSMATVMAATIVLAVVANSYELLCTAGFPMVYTRILTLRSLPAESYYLYLVLYNLIYILPLLSIVVLFTVKLGSRKLSEHEGMVLKLLSGVMMLLLGSMLLVSPQLLNNVAAAAALLLVAIGATWLIVKTTGKGGL